MGRLSYFIAKRYLFAKKSHNVINIISIISAIGIAVGSCALIMVLSIYNGFEDIVRGMYDKAIPDISISGNGSKYFSVNTAEFGQVKSLEGVASFSQSIEETAFLTYDREEMVATVKGVDEVFASEPSILECTSGGRFDLYFGEVAKVVAGRSLAAELRLRPGSLDPVEMFFPDRDKEISLMNPAASLHREVFFCSGVFTSGNTDYNELIFAPIDRVRRLVGVGDGYVTSVELRLVDGVDVDRTVAKVRTILAEDFIVKDKYMQNETVYRMMKIEKVVIFTILLFIMIVISCNVYGSLTMLIIEKRDDIATLKHIGATDSLIKRIFFEEGWLIIMSGALAGLALGILLCLIQQYVGVIQMPGNFVVQYYPVVIKLTDILITLAGIALIGFIITAIPTRRTLSKIL